LKSFFKWAYFLVRLQHLRLSFSPLLQVLDNADKAQPLDFRRFKQNEPVCSAGSFVGISVDNPTPPGQIV